MKVAMVDCETTGLGSLDEPISIAAVLSEVDKSGYGGISAVWYGEQCPTVPISDGAFFVHGRTKQSLVGKLFDFCGLSEALQSVDAIIAHNAEFDHRMIYKIYPAINSFPWFCSYKQWPFSSLINKRLDTLCEHFHISKPVKHDALSDAKCLYAVLMQRSGKTVSSNTYLHTLLKNSAWITPSRKSSHVHVEAEPVVVIDNFDASEITKFTVGEKIYLEQGLESDSLVSYLNSSITERKPIVCILKSRNPRVAEKIELGSKVYLLVTKNDGRSMEFNVRAESNAV